MIKQENGVTVAGDIDERVWAANDAVIGVLDRVGRDRWDEVADEVLRWMMNSHIGHLRGRAEAYQWAEQLLIRLGYSERYMAGERACRALREWHAGVRGHALVAVHDTVLALSLAGDLDKVYHYYLTDHWRRNGLPALDELTGMVAAATVAPQPGPGGVVRS